MALSVESKEASTEYVSVNNKDLNIFRGKRKFYIET
jgi:hypothetical protein